MRRPSSGKNVLARGKVTSWPSSILSLSIAGHPDKSRRASALPSTSSTCSAAQFASWSVCSPLLWASSSSRFARPSRSRSEMRLSETSSVTSLRHFVRSMVARSLPDTLRLSRCVRVSMPARSTMPRFERSRLVTCEASSAEMRPFPSSSQETRAARRAASGNVVASSATPVGTTYAKW